MLKLGCSKTKTDTEQHSLLENVVLVLEIKKIEGKVNIRYSLELLQSLTIDHF